MDVRVARRPPGRRRRRRRPDEGDRRSCSRTRQARSSQYGEARVVGVHPRDVAPARRVEAAVEGAGETEPLVVADTRSRDRRARRASPACRPSSRRRRRSARGRRRSGGGCSAAPCGRTARRRDGDEHGDERRGRHGRPVAYGACRGSLRRSTSSSRRWAASRSSASARLARGADAPRRSGSSSSTRTRTTACARRWPRGGGLEIVLLTSTAGALARAQRCARGARGRRRRVPRRRLRLPARTARAGRGAASPPTRRSTAHRPHAARRRPLLGVVEATDASVADRDNVWNRAMSFTIFLRARVVERVGRFDERLGLGSGTPWHSGEEIDYLIRALAAGRGSSTTRRSSSSTTSRGRPRPGSARRRERRLPPAQARLPAARSRAHARPAGGRRRLVARAR